MSQEEIIKILEEVKDPEIPVLSLIDLGVITSINIDEDMVKIEMTPTFVGCPALEFMRAEVEQQLRKNNIQHFTVTVNFKKTWTSDLISQKGRDALKKFGLSPPSSAKVFSELDILESAVCPLCNSTNTSLKSPFGPTLCRAIYYCNDCKQAFEQFKPV
jgi:ring-1,2-phenylacetyl-CoA epoxidase subunit PaaD